LATNLNTEIKALERLITEREQHMADQNKTEKFRWHHRMMRDKDLKRLEELKSKLNQLEG
jgi:hypothetical protein